MGWENISRCWSCLSLNYSAMNSRLVFSLMVHVPSFRFTLHRANIERWLSPLNVTYCSRLAKIRGTQRLPMSFVSSWRSWGWIFETVLLSRLRDYPLGARSVQFGWGARGPDLLACCLFSGFHPKITLINHLTDYLRLVYGFDYLSSSIFIFYFLD